MRQLERYLLRSYRALLRLYPARFSAVFAEGMFGIFTALLAEAAPQGWWALLQLALKELSGLLLSVVREHISSWRTADMRQRILQSLMSAVVLGCLAFLMLTGLFLDFAIAAPMVRIPVLLFIGLFGSGLGTMLYLGRRTPVTLVSLVLFVTLNVAIWSVDWNSRKPFVRDLYQIEPGMTIGQVDSRMSSYMRSPALSGTLINGAVSYRHTTAAWGNADIGLVRYDANEQVSTVTFLPD